MQKNAISYTIIHQRKSLLLHKIFIQSINSLDSYHFLLLPYTYRILLDSEIKIFLVKILHFCEYVFISS